MKTLTKFFNPILTENLDYSQYEVVENEVLKCSNLKGLNISGSLFSLTTFKNVTFESCVFFGSRIENCTFIDCKFIDCTFQFSAVEHTSFRDTEFVACNWDITPIRKSLFLQCELDAKTAYFIAKDENTLESTIRGEAQLQTSAEGMAPSNGDSEGILHVLTNFLQSESKEELLDETQVFDFRSYKCIAA